jgi:AraC-like DNA-binding protein
VAHGEGRLGSHAYELMWMGLNVETGCFTATSSYRPDTGWRAHSRHRLREPQGRRLLESFSQLALEPGHWDQLQNELLVALVSLHTIAVGAREQDPAPRGDEQATVVADIQRYLRTHLDQPLRLDDVAHLVRLTPNYINSVFRRHAGKTIYAWLVEERMTKSMAMCRETDLPFNQIAAQVGFEDPLYFSKAFRRRFGMSPTEARTANRA